MVSLLITMIFSLFWKRSSLSYTGSRLHRTCGPSSESLEIILLKLGGQFSGGRYIIKWRFNLPRKKILSLQKGPTSHCLAIVSLSRFLFSLQPVKPQEPRTTKSNKDWFLSHFLYCSSPIGRILQGQSNYLHKNRYSLGTTVFPRK